MPNLAANYLKYHRHFMISRLLLFFSILTISIGNAQMNHSLIVLKSGDSLNGFGKLKFDSFKYKNYAGTDKREIDFSQIKLVKIKKSDTVTEIYKFFQTTNNDKFVAVLEVVSGNNVELYCTYSSYPGMGTGMNVGMGAGGMGMGVGIGMSGGSTVTYYFAKRPSEEKLTALGNYNPLSSTLRENVLKYFSDCKALTDKVENKDFRMRSGFEQVAAFYNENCN